MLYKPVSYSIQLDFGLTTTNLNLGDGRLNLALRKWQNSGGRPVHQVPISQQNIFKYYIIVLVLLTLGRKGKHFWKIQITQTVLMLWMCNAEWNYFLMNLFQRFIKRILKNVYLIDIL